MSAALPGAGHIYLGRRILGGIELAGGLALFLTALYRLAGVFLTVLDGAGAPLDLVAPCLKWSLILAGYSVADAAFTLLVSRRRLVTAQRPGRPPRVRSVGGPSQTR